VTSLLPEVESWIKVAGAAVAVAMAALVPIRSWIVEDRRYRAQSLQALSAAASRGTVEGLSGTSHMLADSLAIGALADALRDLTAALRDLAACEEGRQKDRLAQALEALLDQDRRALRR
jgi:hypothetical protein